MHPEAEGNTPTAQWAPPQSWWVGDDARSEDGNEDTLHQPHLPSGSRNGRRRSRLMFTAEAEGSGEGVPHRDSRTLFGDLPNSSLDPDLLGDPIQRELELRAAGAGSLLRNPAAAGPAPAVTFADSARPYSDNFPGNGNSTDMDGFWRDECSRLQGQIASLDREKERWEQERRQLQANDVDRARDLAGLKRAVEAQSQLVMESLVAAQRLAASGATSASPTRARSGALHENILQTAWVQPSLPPEILRDSPRGDVMGGTPLPPWGPPMPPGAGVANNWGLLDYSPANMVEDSSRLFGRRQQAGSGAAAADVAYSPQQSYTPVALAGAAPSPYSPGAAALSRAAESRHGAPVSAPHATASRRDPYELASATNGNRFDASDNNRAPRSSGPVRPTSMDTALTPRGSFGNRRHTLQVDHGGETNGGSRAPHDHRRTAGWRCVSSGRRRNGSGNTAAGNVAEGGGDEVWEWNGRRVVVHVSPPKQSKSVMRREGGANTTGDGEKAPSESRAFDEAEPRGAAGATAATTGVVAEAAPASVVPPSLLNDIQDIKAMVQALAAGAAGAQSSAPLETGLEQQTTVATTVSAPETSARTHQTRASLYRQPKPPDVARCEQSGTPSPHASSPTPRRISSYTDPQTPLETPSAFASSTGASSTGDTSSDRDGAPPLDRQGASGRATSEGHRQRPAVEQQREAQERTQGNSRDLLSTPGSDKALSASSRDGKVGEVKEEGSRAPSAPSRDGIRVREGGPIDAEARDGHGSSVVGSSRADETAADEGGDRSRELTQLNQPVAQEGSSSTRGVAEASRLEGNVGAVKGEVSSGGPELLNEAPENECHVG